MGIYAGVFRWTGWQGSPGFNTMFFRGIGEADDTVSSTAANAAGAQMRAFMFAARNVISSGITGTLQSPMIGRNPVTGAGLSEFTVSQDAVTGASTGDLLPAQASLVVGWRTASPTRAGRGRTFMPPAGEAANTAGGIPIASIIADVDTAAQALIAAGNAVGALAEFIVWHRPVGGAGGLPRTVENHRIRPLWGSLRSRRD